jgi:medium-chain acyl-[acyl-carrier-protein] hydrolase
MNQTPDIWKELRLIEPFDVDTLGRLRPQTLFAYLLNSAWNHAKGTNYGHDELSARNLKWVLIKVKMLINRLPTWGERIITETWGKRRVKLYALRDFTVSLDTGEKLVSATSSWMVVNKTNGRPQRFDQASDSLPWQPGKDEIETDLEKVPELQNGDEVARFRVLFSDIDVNRHVNSAKYLQWMVDSHSHEFLESMEPRSVELSFLAEALPRDEVTVFSERIDDQELCSVRRVGDGKELCRTRFEWRC